MSTLKARNIAPIDGEPSTTITDCIAVLSTSEVTVASGSITVTKGRHTVDTETDAASDDLDTIVTGTDGQVVTLMAENAARVVTVKHNTGNIQLSGGTDFALDGLNDSIILLYNGATSNWVELSRTSIV